MKESVLATLQAGFEALGSLAPAMTYMEAGTPTYDPATATSSSTPVVHSIIGIPAEYSSQEVTGLVEAGDMRVFIDAEALTFVPKTGATMTINGEVWRVIWPHRHYAGDTVAFYELQLRT